MIKKIFLLIVLLVSVQLIFCQNLDKMTKADREAYLIAKTKEYTMKYGPDYYREYKAPEIERGEISERGYPRGKNKYRVYYSVRLPYDFSKEVFVNRYAVNVDFWADTGAVFSITFGNNASYWFDDNNLKSGKDYPVVPYEAYSKEELERMKKESMKIIEIDHTKK